MPEEIDEGFAFTFPIYAVLLRADDKSLLLRNGGEIWLPLFTDRDNAEQYLHRSGFQNMLLKEFAGPEQVIEFLENTYEQPDSFSKIAVDIYSNSRSGLHLFEKDHFLYLLQQE